MFGWSDPGHNSWYPATLLLRLYNSFELWGGGGGYYTLVILLSALGPNPPSFLFWGTFIYFGGLLGQGLGLGLGPGLDNYR